MPETIYVKEQQTSEYVKLNFINLETSMTIDVLSFIFGVYDRLILVQTIVTGYGITDRYSNQVIGRTTEAKQLKCDQDGSDRAVY